jgi:hypothetical protein
MAGYIEMKDGTNVEFHIGQTPEYRLAEFEKGDVENIASVQLDGDELEHVAVHITGIPFNIGLRVQTWRGDSAKFIIENW